MPVTRYKQNKRLSEVSQSGELFIFSGQVSSGNTIREQVEGIFFQLDTLITEAGLTKQNILYANIFFTNMDDYDVFNQLWENWVDQANCQVPSRSAIQVVRLARPEWRVEVQITAAR